MRAFTMYHVLSISLVSCLLLILTGCWDRTEVNDVALITGAAIDKIDESSILLSVQIFIPRTASSGGMSGQSANVGNQASFVSSAKGANIADALSHIQEKLPRKLFWGHAEVFILSEEVAKDGIRDEVDYLMRAPQPRERAYMFVVKGKARQLLDAQSMLERNTAEVMREVAKSKLSLSVTLADLAQMLVDETGAAAIPWIELLPASSSRNNDKLPSPVIGSAIFKEGKMIGKIDEFTTKGVLWIKDEIKHAVITVNPTESFGTVSLRLLTSRTKLKPLIKDGKWSINIQIRAENNALQNSTSLKISQDPQAIKIVENSMNKDIEERIRVALNKVQKEMGADIFDFGGTFHRAYPKEWKLNKAHWGEIFTNLDVTINPHATIQRPGLTSIKDVELKEETGK
ncbi:Ger(x)C family spore germination protein [Paenibacillus roseipurpureus]|uniref:Ger(X)C family spore germination protein n=1 Tax=Paenibacillus roseopurpureus TaxID=2918901 RepID=A0AA96LYD4_9BACL|nr:Ger(x)C family spore germination protein [Paenibacillus sp. MBLB1832]WNR46795.1 Ger(x)C family spore germination protein [Paenibacillus sp. MBLB1832]